MKGTGCGSKFCVPCCWMHILEGGSRCAEVHHRYWAVHELTKLQATIVGRFVEVGWLPCPPTCCTGLSVRYTTLELGQTCA